MIETKTWLESAYKQDCTLRRYTEPKGDSLSDDTVILQANINTLQLGVPKMSAIDIENEIKLAVMFLRLVEEETEVPPKALPLLTHAIDRLECLLDKAA